MKIYYGYKNLNLVKPVVTMGIFDGVHTGHRYLLNTLIKTAKKESGKSVVITFNPHPRLILEKSHKKDLYFLSTIEERKKLLEEAGIDELVIIPFDLEFSRFTALRFVEEVLVKNIGTRYLLLGFDHHFGFMAEGNYSTISDSAHSLNLKIEQASGVKSGEQFISSTMIRNALLEGRIDDANKWLGYCYTLTGKVIEGKKLGRTLGFPTANILPDEHKLIPLNGVYAVEVNVGKANHKGILSIGNNPTVNKLPVPISIEVYILDFNDHIYGSELTITFRYRLRDEKKFSNTEELVSQMKLDLEASRRLLK